MKGGDGFFTLGMTEQYDEKRRGMENEFEKIEAVVCDVYWICDDIDCCTSSCENDL